MPLDQQDAIRMASLENKVIQLEKIAAQHAQMIGVMTDMINGIKTILRTQIPNE